MADLVILTTDTLHHRFFINFLRSAGVSIDHVLFETTHVEPPFAIDYGYKESEKEFEKRRWAGSLDLDGISISEIENLNCDASKSLLKALKPRVAVTFGARKLRKEVFSIFPSGILNVHRGLTQRYRGLDSELWAIYHDDWSSIGVTIHIIEEALDTGPIVAQEKLVLEPTMKIFQLRALTTEIAAVLVSQSLTARADFHFHSREQKEYGRYYSFMPRDLKYFCESKFNAFCSRLEI